MSQGESQKDRQSTTASQFYYPRNDENPVPIQLLQSIRQINKH